MLCANYACSRTSGSRAEQQHRLDQHSLLSTELILLPIRLNTMRIHVDLGRRRRSGRKGPKALLLATLFVAICCVTVPSSFFPVQLVVEAISSTTTEEQETVDTVTNEMQEKSKLKVRRTSNIVDNAALSSSSSAAASDMTLSQILAEAGRKGLGGGVPGFVAGVIQVLTLMWLRTVVNYQSRYGTTFRQTLITLFNDGGIPRFYRGLSFALVQAPMARFTATAANDGCIALLSSLEMTKHWGPARETAISSVVVALWRMLLMPIDTCKTVLQVDSKEGFKNLMRKVRAGKIGLLYQGCFALVVSSMVGYYPWFYTFRMLSESPIIQSTFPAGLVRNAVIGFSASVVSDIVSNSIRVLKTTKQSMGSRHAVTYGQAISIIVSEDGWRVSRMSLCVGMMRRDHGVM